MIKISVNFRKNAINLLILFLVSIIFVASFSMYKDWKEVTADSFENNPFSSVEMISESELRNLAEINPETFGFIYIPDTEISFPVVKGENNSYYLNHSFTKERNHTGCPFVDYRSTYVDQNTVIHGHNMGYDQVAVFSALIKYENEDYLQSHPYMYFAEPGVEGQQYKIFSVLNFNTKNLALCDYMQRNFKDGESFLNWISYLQSNSLFKIDATISNDSEILILSTCNRAYGKSNRFLLCGVKEV